MKLEEIVRTGLARAEAVGVKRTAINPLLWLVGLISPLSLILAAVADDEITRWILFGFAGVPLIFAFAAYLFLLFTDPDRLQSEEYRIRQQAMKYLYRKGGNIEIVDIANQVPRIEKSQAQTGSGETP